MIRLSVGTFEDNRERTINTNCSRLSAELSNETVPPPARNHHQHQHQHQHQGSAVEGNSHGQPSFGSTLCVACGGRVCDKDGGGREMTGQLGVVGRLHEENLRLGSVVQQLQV